MAQALDPVIADDQVAAGLPASRPHAPPPAQAHGHDDPFAAETDIDD